MRDFIAMTMTIAAFALFFAGAVTAATDPEPGKMMVSIAAILALGALLVRA